MRPELERYQQIDLYLQNKLSAEEKTAFEKAMQNDSGLLEEVEMQRMVNTVVLNAGYNDLKAKMSSDIRRIDKKAKTDTWKKGTAMGIVGLLIVSGGVWLTQSEDEIQPSVKETKTEVIIDSAETLVNEVKEQSAEIKERKQNIEVKIAEVKREKEPKASAKKEDTKPVQQKEEEVMTISTTPEVENKPVSSKMAPQKITQDKAVKENITPEKSEPKDLCKGVSLEITPMIDASCTEMPTGIIDLQDGITGGKLPYKISWKNIDGNKEIQKGLSGGYHSLTIQDANGCTSEHQVFIPTENCVSSDAINPDNGEEWVYTNKKGLPFSIKIINLSGREILRKENIQQEFFIWQGKDRNGASLPAGAYAWVVEYSDGTHNTGQITVIR